MPKSIRSRKNRVTQGGYILLYVVIAVTIFAALASSVVSSTMTQVELGAQELAGTRATLAADMALECMQYYANKPERPFYTNTASMNIVCGPGLSFASYGGDTTAPCTAWKNSIPYQVPLYSTVADGAPAQTACAHVTVTTQPKRIRLRTGPSTYRILEQYCALEIRVDGYDGACGSVNSETVHTRWARYGGFNATTYPPPLIDAPPVDIQKSGTPPTAFTKNYPKEEYCVAPTCEYDPQGKKVLIATTSHAVFQVERSNVHGFRSMTNPVRFTMQSMGALSNPAGPTIDILVKTSNTLDGYLDSLSPDRVMDVDIRKPNGDALTGGVSVGDSFDITLGVPSDLPANIYLVRVTAMWRLGASSTLIIPLEVSSSTRGQY